MTISEKWKRTVDDGLTNAAWDEHDALIKEEVGAYNTKFVETPGYGAVDWKLLKAVLWVESGGPGNPAWKKRPMQIGNPGDPALRVMQDGKEGSDLVMNAQLKIDIKGDINEPKLNIRVGIAYLFTRMMKSRFESVLDPKDGKAFEYKVVAGDTFAKIAKKVGSTTEALETLNPPKERVLQPGEVITCRKASLQRVVTGWLSFNTSTVAQRYNAGGDPDYSAKLDYVIALFAKLKR